MPLFLHVEVATWKIVIGEMYIWEVAAWEIAHLGSWHLGNCHLASRPWEKAFEKIPFDLL